MIKKCLIVLGVVLFVACNGGNDPGPTQFDIFYNRVSEYDGVRAGSEMNYRFDEQGNYDSFYTSRLFFEIYNNADSLVVDDYTTNVSNAYITRRAFKFNAGSVVVYKYNNRQEFIESRQEFDIDANQLIKEVRLYSRVDGNNPFQLLERAEYDHNASGNLTEIRTYADDWSIPDPGIQLRLIRTTTNFRHLEQPLPNVARGYVAQLRPEIQMILYNKGYVYSKFGLQSYTEELEFDGRSIPIETVLTPQSESEVTLSFRINNQPNDTFDCKLIFYSEVAQ